MIRAEVLKHLPRAREVGAMEKSWMLGSLRVKLRSVGCIAADMVHGVKMFKKRCRYSSSLFVS